MRCRAHGLAVGPDGRCVLCRESERPVTDAEAPARGALTLFAAGAVLIVVAALLIRVAVGLPAAPVEPPSNGSGDPRFRSAGRVEPPSETPPRPNETDATARFVASPTPVPEAASPSPVTVDAGSPPTTVGASPTPPSNSAIQAALRQTRIVMYATSWCPHCTRARAFLEANGLTREEHDVDHDERARAELKRLTGKGSVPVFVVDGELVSGFNAERMTRVLVASVERRLGVKGLRVRTAEGP